MARPLVVLERIESGTKGTFGTAAAGSLRLYSCERPWRDNQPNISCIPVGRYDVIWTYSPRFRRETYLVGNVPGRSGIRIHPANFPEQLAGCIAFGERLGYMDDRRCVLVSRPAIEKFEKLLDHKPFILEIR